MNTEPTFNNYYQVGGSLPFTATTYVVRQADEELYAGIKAGSFCYVLNSRQMGKSSLRVRTMKRLEAEGFICCAIEMRDICSYEVTPDEFFGGFLSLLASGFDLAIDLGEWWFKYGYISPLMRLNRFIETEVLDKFGKNIVIFIDEIDNILNLEFKDDFFAFVTSCYNKRADSPQYNRLTFALLGVATPADLIADTNLTPFNIDSQSVELTGFKFPQVTPLVQGFMGIVRNPQAVLQEILNWTGGQPFLTQWLCQVVATYPSIFLSPNCEGEWIARIVQERIIDNCWTQDKQQHLQTIRERLLSNESRSCRLLGLYQQILQQGEIIADDSREQMELRLSGLVVKQQGKLKVYNRIYESVFNLVWVEKELTNLRPDFYTQIFTKWAASECQDTNYLLRDEALQKALVWATGRSLSDLDYQFISDSQNFAIQNFEIALENAAIALNQADQQKQQAQRQVNRVLQQIQVAKLQLRRTIMVGSAVICSMIFIAAVLAQKANLAAHQTELEKKKTILAQAATQQAQQDLKQANQREKFAKEKAAAAEEQQLRAETLALNAKNRLSLAEIARKKAQLKAQQAQNLALDAQNRRELAEAARQYAQQKADATEQQRQKKGQELAETQVLLLSSSALTILEENPFDVMLTVIQAGQKLKELEKSQPIENSTKNQITFALQQVMLRIRERNRLENHQSAVLGVSFSPDGKYLASASEDNTVILWTKNGSLLLRLTGHKNKIWSVNFSPDSKILASASDDGTVKLWSVPNGQLIKTINAHNTRVINAVFSRDGKVLASCASQSTIKLWNVENGTLLNTLKAQPGSLVTNVSFSPDGKTLASAHTDTTIKLWNLENGNFTTLKGHTKSVRTVDFSRDRNILASGSEDGTVKLWDLKTGSILNSLEDHRTAVWSVAFSPDGKTLASASSDSTVKLWNVWDIRNISTKEPQTLKGHQGIVWSIAFSPDGKTLASGSTDKTIKLWSLDALDTSKLQILQTHDIYRPDLIMIGISPDGRLFAPAGESGILELWDMEKKTRLFSLQSDTKAAIHRVEFSPDSLLIAATSDDKKVRLWNVKDGQLFKTLADGNTYTLLTFSPDGKILATRTAGKIQLWNVANGTPIKTLKGNPAERCGIRSIHFSPDSKILALTCSYGNLQLWDSKTGALILHLKGQKAHSNHVSTISFSPDSQIMASAGADATIKVWKVADGTLIRTINAHVNHIRRLTFSPDGKTLASAGDDRTIKLWNFADITAKNLGYITPTMTLTGHRNLVNALSFTPDGKRLISGSYDNSVKVWNLNIDWDDFLKLSCLWLEDYFVTQPEEREKFYICKSSRI